jgi:hypothetical protein
VSNYDATETTVVPGALRGYRAWRVTPSGLGSMSTGGYLWRLKEHARCYRNDVIYINAAGHHAPVRGCTCGFYAKHTLDSVEDEFPYKGFMFGSIRAHGRIILGDSGFKAEYAEIEALLWRGESINIYSDELSNVLRSVPIYANRKNFLRDYPPISVENLLPEPEPKPTLQWGRINASAQISADFAKLWANYTSFLDIDKES